MVVCSLRGERLSESMDAYMRQLSRLPKLALGEHEELDERLRRGDDRTAIERRFVESHLALVISRIRLFPAKHIRRKFLDAIQEGNLGLMHAARKYDPDKGASFTTYSTFWIDAYLRRFLNTGHPMGSSQADRHILYNAGKAEWALILEGERVTSHTIAERLGADPERVRDVLNAKRGYRVLSLDQPVHAHRRTNSNENDSLTLGDSMPSAAPSPEECVIEAARVRYVRKVAKRVRKNLKEIEQQILDERILSDAPTTLEVIADRFGVCRERIRQREEVVIRKIAASLRPDMVA